MPDSRGRGWRWRSQGRVRPREGGRGEGAAFRGLGGVPGRGTRRGGLSRGNVSPAGACARKNAGETRWVANGSPRSSRVVLELPCLLSAAVAVDTPGAATPAAELQTHQWFARTGPDCGPAKNRASTPERALEERVRQSAIWGRISRWWTLPDGRRLGDRLYLSEEPRGQRATRPGATRELPCGGGIFCAETAEDVQQQALVRTREASRRQGRLTRLQPA